MKSISSFIVRPLESRYNNKINIDGKELITNSSIEPHSYVSKKALIVETPLNNNSNIKKGDHAYIHHNIFRRWYNQKGEEKNGSTYFKDDLYFCNIDQIYMYNLKCNLNYCFVKPVLNTNSLSVDKEKKHFGILKYSNSSLEDKGLTPGDVVVFTPNSEFEFIVEGERLYCMKSNDISLTYEHEGNEIENNPSWAKSS